MIKAAAINIDGVIYTLPAPARHHDIISHCADVLKLNTPIMGEQGFIDDTGKFLMRRYAANIAMREGQITKLMSPPYLYSEDLW